MKYDFQGDKDSPLYRLVQSHEEIYRQINQAREQEEQRKRIEEQIEQAIDKKMKKIMLRNSRKKP